MNEFGKRLERYLADAARELSCGDGEQEEERGDELRRIDQASQRLETSQCFKALLDAARAGPWTGSPTRRRISGGQRVYTGVAGQLRCFLRATHTYQRLAAGREVRPHDLVERLQAELARTEVTVWQIVVFEGVSHSIGEAIDFGPTTFAPPGSELHERIQSQRELDVLFMGHTNIPAEIRWCDLLILEVVVERDRLKQVGSGAHRWFDFVGGRRRFPQGHGSTLDRALDPMRVYDWLAHQLWHADDPVDFLAPKMDARLRLHDSALAAPFRNEPIDLVLHEELARYDDDDVEVEVTGPELWIGLDEEASANFRRFLVETGARRAALADTGWTYVERAFQYLRKAEQVRGFDQLVMLLGAVEALIGDPEPGLSGRLKRRWAVLLGSTRAERKARRDQFERLYGLRSGYLHGGSGPDALDVNDARELNQGTRLLISRLLGLIEQLNGLGVSPSRQALLGYLDAAHRGDLDGERAVLLSLQAILDHAGESGFPAFIKPK